MQAAFEVADVLRHTNLAGLSLGVHQQKTLRALQHCRTAALGGHVDACNGCGNISISYNSCRNRHCPKCQGHKREEWIQRREADLLPCSYYHVVFTLPPALNTVALQQPKLVYDSLFVSVWHTLKQFGAGGGCTVGHDIYPAYLGAKLKPASAPALYCARWWCICARPMAKAIAEQQVFVFSKGNEQGVQGKVCARAKGAKDR